MGNLSQNPMDKSSNLSTLSQKAILIKEGLGVFKLIEKIGVFAVIGLVLFFVLKIPVNILLLLIGFELFVVIASTVIKIKKIKSLIKVETEKSAESYRTLLIISGYFEVLKSIFSTVGALALVGVVLLFFQDNFLQFTSNSIGFLTPSVAKKLIFVFAIYHLVEFATHLVKYTLVKKIKLSDDFAEIDKAYRIINKKIALLKNIPIISIVLFGFYLFGVPGRIMLFFAAAIVVITILSVIEIGRIKKVDVSSDNFDKSIVRHEIKNLENEKVNASVFGILRVVSGLKDAFKPQTVGGLGIGKNYFPENSMLITDKRLLFIQVPVSGGNKVVDQTDYASQNVMFNRGEIKSKGEEIVKTQKISEILKIATNDVLFEDIKSVVLKKSKIVIEKKNNEKSAYFIPDKENIEIIRNNLQDILKEKLLED